MITNRQLGKAMSAGLITYPKYSKVADKIASELVLHGVQSLSNKDEMKAAFEVMMATGAALSKTRNMVIGAAIGIGICYLAELIFKDDEVKPEQES